MGGSILIAIAGLAFLVLIHESGHFCSARAVGMKPRRFYVGFPPAILKTTRKGIEYGIGAIPLGGYVKIPGMHRPAPSDLDTSFGPALLHEPSLVGPVERLKRLVAEGDFAEARTALASLDEELARVQLPPVPARGARRRPRPRGVLAAANLEARPRDRGGPADEHRLRDCRAGGRLHAGDP